MWRGLNFFLRFSAQSRLRTRAGHSPTVALSRRVASVLGPSGVGVRTGYDEPLALRYRRTGVVVEVSRRDET